MARDAYLALRVSKELKRSLQEEADARDISVADVVREKLRGSPKLVTE